MILPVELKLKIASHINDDVDFYSYWQAVFGYHNISEAAAWMVKFRKLGNWQRFYYPTKESRINVQRRLWNAVDHHMWVRELLECAEIGGDIDMLEAMCRKWCNLNTIRNDTVNTTISEAVMNIKDILEDTENETMGYLTAVGIYRAKFLPLTAYPYVLETIGPENCAELKENLYKLYMKIIIIAETVGTDNVKFGKWEFN